MCPATGAVMLFEDENLPVKLRQREGGGETSRSRTDDDYIVIHLAAPIDKLNFIRLVGNEAQKFEILCTNFAIPVRRPLRDEYHIPSVNIEGLIADPDGGMTLKDILLVLKRVGMFRHPSTGLHDKAAHGKIRPFRGRDQDLERGLFSRFENS